MATIPMSSYRTFLYETFTLALAPPIIILNVSKIIYIVTRRLQTYKSGSTLFILSLSISDLLLGVNMLVLKVMHRFINTDLKNDNAARVAYDVIRFACIRLAFFLSILNLTAITVDRYEAIKNPYIHRIRRTRVFVKVCVAIWLTAVVLTITLYMVFTNVIDKDGKQYMNLLFPIPTFIAFVVFLYCYVRIYQTVKTLRRKCTAVYSTTSACTSSTHTSREKDGQRESKSPCDDVIVSVNSRYDNNIQGDGKPPQNDFSVLSGENFENKTFCNAIVITNPSAEGAEGKDVGFPVSVTRTKLPGKKEKRNSSLLHRKELERRLLKLSVARVTFFAVCWSPLAICCILDITKLCSVEKDIFSSFFVLAYNSFINPITYYINMRKERGVRGKRKGGTKMTFRKDFVS